MCMEGLTNRICRRHVHAWSEVCSAAQHLVSKTVTRCSVLAESAENCLIVQIHVTQAVVVASVAAHDVLHGLRSAYQ